MHAHLVISGAILALFFISPAQAQVTLDASKVTCDQFVHSKIGGPRTVGAWLSGFYNGKSNNAVINREDFEANLPKLVKFCYDEKNFKVPVMQAVEQAIGSGKK